jgi:hypothetical protein
LWFSNKYILAGKKITTETDKDFKLVGIGTTLRDYKLCYHIAEVLESEFIKMNGHDLDTKDRSTKITFSVFKSERNAAKTLLLLFANKSMGETLLPEAASFDFLLKITGSFPELKEMIRQLKLLPEIIAIAEIPPKTIKHPERLQYEEIIEKPAFSILKNRRK